MSHGKQFTLYSHRVSPNGWKVAAILEELGLTYESIYLEFDEKSMKAPEYTKYNPNGRIPAIIDHHNNDFVLWESCAILIYLAEKYDLEHKISTVTEDDKFRQLQWLMFQASGQGPYFGQSTWFQFFHKEKHPDVVERYNNEIRRVYGVLESVLAKTEYLVGGKPTIADMAFISWNFVAITRIMPNGELDLEKEFPAVAKWHNKIFAREAFKKVYAIRASFSPNY